MFKLGAWPRVWCVVLGLLGLSGGTTATFRTTNSIGTGAMLLIGALFEYVGVTGIAITRASIGGNDFYFYEDALQDMLETPDPEVQERAAEVVLQSDIPATSPVRRRAQLLEHVREYENQVLEAITRIGYGAEPHQLIQIPRPMGDQVDAIVQVNMSRIGIEIKYSSSRKSANNRYREAVIRQ